MKKVWIIVLIVFLISLIGTLGNILIYAIMNGGDVMWGGTSRITENIIKEEKIDVLNIKDLKLDFGASDVNVIITDNPELRIIQYANKSLKDNEKFTVSKTDERVEVRDNYKRFGFFMTLITYNVAYDIYIPKDYSENLDISSTSGDINISEEMILKDLKLNFSSGRIQISENMKADNINIKTISGDIYTSRLDSANDLEINSTSGQIRTSQILGKEVKIKTVSGDIEIGNIESKELEVKSTSGKINIESVTENIKVSSVSGEIGINNINGAIEAKTTSGRINLSNFNILGASTVNSVSGDLKIVLTENVNCKIKTKTTSGIIRLPNDENTIGTDPYNELNLKTTSGSINVK